METKIKVYNDGAVIRMKNRRVEIVQKEDHVGLLFRFADAESYKPAVKHTCLKGRVRESYIKIGNETMEAIVVAYLKYRKSVA